MPKRPTLEQLVHRAVTFPGPSARLAGMHECLTAVEEQIAFLESQHRVRLAAELERNDGSMHPDDIDMEIYQTRQTVEALFPKVFRGGFVVALWSVFEASIKDMAEYTRRTKSFPFGLQDLRAGDFLGQTEKFFHGAVSLDPFPDKLIRKKLEELRGLRNALAHHDGSTTELPKSLMAKSPEEYLALGLYIYRDLHHEYAVPTTAYAEASLSVVEASLESLAKSLYRVLHPQPD